MSDANSITVEYWHGRHSADPATIYCTQNGRATALWEESGGRWDVVSVMLRPIISQGFDGSFALGESRRIFPAGEQP
jgi:hypothetical protein